MAMAAAASSSLLPGRLSLQDPWQRSHALPVASSSSSYSSSICAVPLKQVRFVQRSRKNAAAFAVFCVAAPSIEQPEVEAEDPKDEEQTSPLIPTSAEIHSLLKEVCDQTKIAELDVKVGAFKLHVKRNVETPKAAAPAPAPVPTAASAPAPSKAPAGAKAAPKPSGPRVSPLMSKAVAFDDLQKTAANAGVVLINAPKVGIFRQSKLVKGKFGPPLCREGQIVNEGQVICYLEQLGTQTPVESEVSGTVIQILWEDGVPVGYGDPLIAVRPKKA